jgi:hypothetical protein
MIKNMTREYMARLDVRNITMTTAGDEFRK